MNGQRAEATPAAGGRALEGKVAVVVGASRGIGAAVARAFSAAGADVALAARDEPPSTSWPASWAKPARTPSRSRPTSASPPPWPRSSSAPSHASDGSTSRASTPPPAGTGPRPLADVDVEAFDSAVAVNLRAAFVAMNQELPEMVAAGGGAIVNMSSTAGRLRDPGAPHQPARGGRRRGGLAVLGRGGVRRKFLDACPNRPPCCDVFSRPSLRSATSDQGGRHGTGIGQDRRRHGRLR